MLKNSCDTPTPADGEYSTFVTDVLWQKDPNYSYNYIKQDMRIKGLVCDINCREATPNTDGTYSVECEGKECPLPSDLELIKAAEKTAKCENLIETGADFEDQISNSCAGNYTYSTPED